MRRAVEQWVEGGGWLVEVLLPRTDAGVAAQLAFVVVTGSVAWWAVRKHRDARFLVGAVVFFVLSLFALRTLH